METIKEAKEYIQNNAATGVRCPCCTRMVKIYKRKFSARNAYRLINLFKLSIKHPTQTWFHISDIQKENDGEFAKLRYWGLIKEKQNDNDERRCSGEWSITEMGTQFVKNTLQVSEYAITILGNCIDLTGDSITIKDALISGEFNYAELMGEYIPSSYSKQINLF